MASPTHYCTIQPLYGVHTNFISAANNSQLLLALQQQQQLTQQASCTVRLTVPQEGGTGAAEYTVYVSWNGAVFTPPQQTHTSIIGVPIELQQCLHLPPNTRIAANIVSQPPVCTSIEVQPASVNDYEVIESNANDIEMNLLAQLNIINLVKVDGEYCKFPYYVRNKQLIYLQPVNSQAGGTDGYVRLGQSSEISVVPLTRKRDQQPSADAATVNNAPPPHSRLRVQPVDDDTAELLLDRYVYMTQTTMDRLLLAPNALVTIQYTSVHTTNSNDSTHHTTVARAQYSAVVATGHIVIPQATLAELRCNCFEFVTVQGVHNTVVQQYDKAIHSIILQPVQFTHNDTAVKNKHNTADDVIESGAVLSAWHNYVSFSKHALSVLSGSIIQLDGYTTPFCVHINTRDDTATSTATQTNDSKHVSVRTLPLYYLLAESEPRTKKPLIKPTLNTLPHTVDYVDTTVIHNQYTLDQLGGIADVITPVTTHLNLLLSPHAVKQRVTAFKHIPAAPGGVLITGATGLGKTALCYALAQMYRNQPDVYALPIMLSGNTLASHSKVSAVMSKLKSTFKHAITHSPALIVIDDIDALVPASSGEQQNDSNALRSLCVAELLNDLLTDVNTKYHKYPVSVVMTQKTATSTHAALQTAQLLSLHVTLKTPGTDARSEVLTKLFARYNVSVDSKLDMSRIALKCQDGMTCVDLLHIVDRSIHNATVRYMQSHSNQPAPAFNDGLHIDTDFHTSALSNGDSDTPHKLIVKSTDIDRALIGYTPAALKHLNLTQQTRALTFADIGSLNDVKQTLRDTLELPSKFARLFGNIPIKLRSGILLYGPPGCGKTLIATAAAKEVGLNMISVKGPELLNKYIGASEQAVRDVFNRARAAAPCILLFDEFESIAPKRGGDSTGVTDRVVNQFLCELDGVESRGAGVYILAASSRPDMIDPALLRPGRIDKTLYCPFPDERARRDVLEVCIRQMDKADDVDLQYIAEETENYSSADLNAIVTTAQINTLHRLIDTHTAQNKQANGHHKHGGADRVADAIAVPPLTQEALLTALADSAPSLNLKQRKMYDAVYDKFVESKQAQPAVEKFDATAKMKTAFA